MTGSTLSWELESVGDVGALQDMATPDRTDR